MKPIDISLYDEVKQLANKKFIERTSAYRSAWIVKQYKSRGGRYSGKKPKKTGLSRWFMEEWVDLNRPDKDGYKPCGRATKTGKYPLCRPSKRITRDTPKTYMELSPESIRKALKLKKDTKMIRF